MAAACEPTFLKTPKPYPPNSFASHFRPFSICISSSLSASSTTHLKSSPTSLKPSLSALVRYREPLKPKKPAPTTIKSLFTGIVEEVGQIQHLGPSQDGGVEMRIAAKTVLGGVQLGDSIAVNGACLTVSAFDPAAAHFTVGLSPETLRRTDLGDLESGSPVNLERALQPISRMGGHFVQWHVDGTGEIVGFEPEGEGAYGAGPAPVRGAEGVHHSGRDEPDGGRGVRGGGLL